VVYVRVWKVLNALHVHLVEGKTVTQRGLYYLLATRDPSLFPRPEVVNDSLKECVSLLMCSRHAMGVTTSSRGQVAGSVEIRGSDRVWKDCRVGDYVIPGNLGELLDVVEFRNMEAGHGVVVEHNAPLTIELESCCPCMGGCSSAYPSPTMFPKHHPLSYLIL
jgi:DNA topoisomerase VI subunit A